MRKMFTLSLLIFSLTISSMTFGSCADSLRRDAKKEKIFSKLMVGWGILTVWTVVGLPVNLCQAKKASGRAYRLNATASLLDRATSIANSTECDQQLMQFIRDNQPNISLLALSKDDIINGLAKMNSDAPPELCLNNSDSPNALDILHWIKRSQSGSNYYSHLFMKNI